MSVNQNLPATVLASPNAAAAAKSAPLASSGHRWEILESFTNINGCGIQTMSGAMDQATPPREMEEVQQDKIALARSAAKSFCAAFNFPADQISLLDGPLLVEPVSLERGSRPIVAYRWLGGGRGDYYIQVEVYQDKHQVVVYGGYSHQEFGPWDWPGPVFVDT